ncbi:PTS sugar transporter subunit IIA, partial [Ileibacterium valens]
MTEIILASHGSLSKGLLNTLSMIVGNPGDHVRAYSLNPGENPRDFLNELELEVTRSENQYIIMTDIQGGSVHTALSELIQYPNVALFSGMNLPMALEVLT